MFTRRYFTTSLRCILREVVKFLIIINFNSIIFSTLLNSIIKIVIFPLLVTLGIKYPSHDKSQKRKIFINLSLLNNRYFLRMQSYYLGFILIKKFIQYLLFFLQDWLKQFVHIIIRYNSQNFYFITSFLKLLENMFLT